MEENKEDLDIAFEMLDRDRDGFLNRRDARYWMRCIGFCLSDQELDKMLNLSLSTFGGRESMFSFRRLSAVADSGRSRRGPDLTGLRRTLCSYIQCVPVNRKA